MTEEQYSVNLTLNEIHALISCAGRTTYDRIDLATATSAMWDVYNNCKDIELNTSANQRYVENNDSNELDEILYRQSQVKKVFTEVLEESLATRLKEIDEQIKKIIEKLLCDSGGSNNGEWDIDEELKPLNIKSPPDWNEYNSYLMDGGTLEYDVWRQHTKAQSEPVEYPDW